MTTRKYKSRKNRSRCRRTRTRTIRKGNGIRGAAPTTDVAAQKIQTFMKNPQVTERRISRFLKNICSDSNVCIAFGVEQPKIYEFFHGYTDKKYIQLPIRPIGEPSRNGFANEIEYMRDGYVSHAVLKSSLKPKADNLVYEYIVGKYMNKMAKYYPCIIQTYALLQYGDADSYHMMQMSKDSITTPEELEMVKLNPVQINTITDELLLDACQYPMKYSVLTQSIKNAIPFTHVRRDGNPSNIVLALHQVYFTLHCMRMTFTHYDLHMSNVVCYNVGQNKYIEFVYHMKDGVTLKYNYNRLSYMLDYGRSFFYESPENNSAEILDKLCKIPCPTPCGAGNGFKNLFGNESVHITGYKRNISADLRLLKLGFQPVRTPNVLFANTRFDGEFGTPEVIENGLNIGKIYNVTDAFFELSRYVNSASKEVTKKYVQMGFTKMGTLHIYEDGITPMEYEPIPERVVTVLESIPASAPAVATAISAPSPAPMRPTPMPHKIDTRVSTAAMAQAPYFTEYMNISPSIKRPRMTNAPPLPPRPRAQVRTQHPAVVDNTIKGVPFTLPDDIAAFYNAETPK